MREKRKIGNNGYSTKLPSVTCEILIIVIPTNLIFLDAIR